MKIHLQFYDYIYSNFYIYGTYKCCLAHKKVCHLCCFQLYFYAPDRNVCLGATWKWIIGGKSVMFDWTYDLKVQVNAKTVQEKTTN